MISGKPRQLNAQACCALLEETNEMAVKNLLQCPACGQKVSLVVQEAGLWYPCPACRHKIPLFALPEPVSQERLLDRVAREPLPVLVLFRAQWSQPSLNYEIVLQHLSHHFFKRIRVLCVDVRPGGSVSSGFGVIAIPTIILYARGKEVLRFERFMAFPELKKELAPFLAQVAPGT